LPLIETDLTTAIVPTAPEAAGAPVKNAALPGVQVPAAPEAVLPLSGKAISKVTLPGTANPLEPVRLGAITEVIDPAFTEAEVVPVQNAVMFGTNVPVNPWAALAPVSAVVLLNAIDPVSPDAVMPFGVIS